MIAVKPKNSHIDPKLFDALRKSYPHKTHENVSLALYTTFRCTGKARMVIEPENTKELEDIIKTFLKFGVDWGRDWAVIGRGSNLLVRDGGFPGTLIDLQRLRAIEVLDENEKEIRVRVEAGVANGTLLQWLREKKCKGFGFAFGIPGSIGGGIRMNAGTPLGWFADILFGVEGVTIQGKTKDLAVTSKDFAYRDFPKGRTMVITAGRFRFSRSSKNEVEMEIEKAKKQRENQPLEFPNIGSVFKNPKGGFAGNLIEQSGLKGLRIGDAEVSTQHANFIINRGKASTDDVLSLMTRIQEEVKKQFNVTLEPEVHVMGVEL